MSFYTKYGDIIRNPEAYAKTGAPMFQQGDLRDINKETQIYKLNLEFDKKYIGKTANLQKRLQQHCNGNGAEVTKKFKPKSCQILDEVPGYFSDKVEQYYTDINIEDHGYENVRGGKYVNSKTLIANDQDYIIKMKNCETQTDNENTFFETLDEINIRLTNMEQKNCCIIS